MAETRIKISAEDLASEVCAKVKAAVQEMGLAGTQTGEVMGTALTSIQTHAKATAAEMRALSSVSTTVGAGLTAAVTVPLVGMGAAALQASIDFESAFAGVKKTVSGTPAELQAINHEFREMATQTPMSAVGLAKIGEMAGQLGVQKEQIVGFTKTIVDISTATNLTADEAGSSFARLANVMKMPQDQFANLGSAVVALGNFGASTEQEMMNMGQRIAAAGSTAGMSAAQVLGIANALSSVGIEAESGGTAMSRVINKISQDVASGGGKLEVFAKIAGKSAGEFKTAWKDNAGVAFSDFMQGLAQARERGGDELLGLIKELGFDTNVRLVNAFMSAANAGNLMKDSIALGSKAFQENTELTRAAGERYQTTANQLKIFWQNVDEAKMSLGDALLPILNQAVVAVKPLVEHFADAARAFRDLPQPVQMAGLALAGVAAAAGPLLIAVGGVAFTISQVSTALVAVPALGTAAAAAYARMAVGLTTLAGGSAAAATAVDVLGSSMSALWMVSGPLIAAYAGWKLGPMVGDWLGFSDAIERTSLRVQRFVGLIGGATDADIANAVAANRAAREHDGLASAADKAADAAKRLADTKDRLSGALASKDLATLTQAANDFAKEGTLSTGVMMRLGAEAERLGQAGGTLSPVLQSIVDAMHHMKDAAGQTGHAAQTLADKVAALTAEQRADIDSKRALGGQIKSIAAETGVATEVVSAYLAQVRTASKGQGDWAKTLREYNSAGEDYRTTVEGMSGATVEAIRYDLTRIKSHETLQKMYGVTAEQMKAIVAVMHDEIEATKILDAARADAGKHIRKALEDELAGEVKYAEASERSYLKQMETREQLQKEANTALKRETLKQYDFEREQINQWVIDQSKSIDVNVDGWEKALDDIDTIAATKYRKVAQAEADAFAQMKAQENTWSNGIQKILGGIPDLVIKGLTGGGGMSSVGQALMSGLGALGGDQLITKPLTSLFNSAAPHLLNTFGSTITTAIGGAVPFIGPAIGALAPAMIDGLKKLFGGPSQLELDGRKLEAAFEQSFGGFQKMIDAVGQAYEATGRGAQAAQADVAALMAAEKQGGASVQTVIDRINVAFSEQKQHLGDVSVSIDGVLSAAQATGVHFPRALQPALDKILEMHDLTDEQKRKLHDLTVSAEPDFGQLEQLASSYGISLEQLGPRFQQSHIDTLALQYFDAFTKLTDAGGDVSGVLSGMSPKINTLIHDALTFGVSVPEAMKPMLQKLVDMGQLTDTNGKKLSDLSGFSFDDSKSPLDKAVDKLTKALDHLGDILGGLPGAAGTAASGIANALNNTQINPIHVPLIFDRQDDLGDTSNYASRGGYVSMNRVEYMALGGFPGEPHGADNVPVWMRKDEAILNPRATAALGRETISDLNHGRAPSVPTFSMKGLEQRIDALHATIANQGRMIATMMKTQPAMMRHAMRGAR